MCTLSEAASFFSPPTGRTFQYLSFDLVVSEAQVLEVGGRIGLDRRELMLQHLDHLWQLWVPPAELPEDTGRTSGQVQGSSVFDCRHCRECGATEKLQQVSTCCFVGDV